MIANSTKCPVDAEEIAEAYIIGALMAQQATAFEDHYIGCNRCATVLQEFADYVGAMREAAKKITSESPNQLDAVAR